MILVVGGTGELGSAVVRRLLERGDDVGVLVRPGSDVDTSALVGVRIVRGDLTDPDGLAGCCLGVDAIVATASSIVPRRGERVRAGALTAGYAELSRQADLGGVGRIVFVSVPRSLMGRGASEFAEKAAVEAVLQARRTPTTVVRPSLFMQSWLPAVGSRLALEGAVRPTLDRGFWLTRLVGATLHRTLDRWGVALVPGAGSTRHSFVDLDDVAGVVAAATARGGGHDEIDVGGPDALSWKDVARIHADVLGVPARTLRTPTAPMRLLAHAVRPFSPAGANLLAAQDVLARFGSVCSPDATAELLGRAPVSVTEFLTERLARRSDSAPVRA